MPPTTTTTGIPRTHVFPLPTAAPGCAADNAAGNGDALGASHTQPRRPRCPHASVGQHPTVAPPRVMVPAVASGDVQAAHTPHATGVGHHPTFVPHRVMIAAAASGDVNEWW